MATLSESIGYIAGTCARCETGLALSSGTSTTWSGSSNTYTNLITNITENNINTIMQNKVAVFKVTRDEDSKITSTEFIKELWVETKNNQSADFQVARDKDLAKYEASDLVIKTIHTVTF